MDKTALHEIGELKKLMVAKIQKTHHREKQTESKISAKNDRIRVLESELKKCQDDSKNVIDELMAELKNKDKQILRVSAAYRQQKDDLSKTRLKLSVSESENASYSSEMKRSKSRVASISESLNLAQVLGELKKIKEENSKGDKSRRKNEKPDDYNKSPAKTKSFSIQKNLTKITEILLDWVASLNPSENSIFMDYCHQVTPYVANLSHLSDSAVNYLLKIAQLEGELHNSLKYFHLPKNYDSKNDTKTDLHDKNFEPKNTDSMNQTIPQHLLLITVCARSSRYNTPELSDSLQYIKSISPVQPIFHKNLVKAFSFLSGDRRYRKDVVEILRRNEIGIELPEEVLRTIYLTVSADAKNVDLLSYLKSISFCNKGNREILERLGLLTVLKTLKIEDGETSREVFCLADAITEMFV
jgi:hypothetical protein